VVFHPLQSEQLEQILEIELDMVQRRVLETAKGRFLFNVMPAAREFLLREGTDLKYGARHLKRAIERYVVCPLATLLATDQVLLGDVVSIDWSGREQRLAFSKEAEGAIISSKWPTAENAATDSRGTFVRARDRLPAGSGSVALTCTLSSERLSIRLG